ncbi:hypothetical protein INT48_000383 [Thamnidium elegans]|uniref:PH domain-containing protein n=1 Tax=Thamnidium elegans TaxID=101142 RepID=A0A8H7SNR1_9FUNG|nr:hypothetical protein INT48_000383 [Thamnidium elegans]
MSSPPPKHSLSSPTSGNTPHPVLPTPSSSTSVSIRQNNKTSQLRQELEQQLVEKQKQLQESSSGIGKNVLARQVSQLQDRIKEIDSSSTDEVQPISVDRLRSLERDPASYRSHPLSPGMSSMPAGLDPLPSPSASTLLPPTHGHDSTSLLPLPPPPTGSTPTKRRSKIPNTDRRNTDIEFATEIGQGLLLEVRKMQALLQEKEEKLRTLENQKADLERAAEAMAKQMRQREENEEKLKEETWNLELAKQELTISVTELQQNLSKANVEQNKLAKQVNTLRTEIEQLRDKEEKLTHSIDNMKQRHEQDMSSIRRHAAAIQREKTDQSKQIEALTSELAIAKAQSRIHKHVVSEPEPTTHSSEATDDQTTSVLAVKNDTSPSSSPPSSPKQTPTRNQAMEVETLKTSLAHAHRMVSNLRSNLHKEKTEKFEFKKLLADSQETIEQLQNDPRMWVDAGPARGNSTSNVFSREDGLPSRRSHKASTSSTTRRRVKKNSTAGRSKLKPPHLGPVGDDSVYSYASMSEDSEDVDSFEESDAGFENVSSKKKHMFTPLSSELSQSQLQDHKPIMIDAQVNTEPLDDFMLPTSVLENSQVESPQVTGSLGDELGRAMSQKSPKGDEMSLNHMAGGLIAGAGAALGIEALKKKAGIEISTQTESQLEVHEISIQTEPLSLQEEATATISVAPTIIKLDMVSQPSMNVEPEDPTIALAATAAAIAAAIAASRSEALEAAVDCSTQFDSEIALADTEALIAESRTKALEAAVDGSTQFDSEIALADTEALIAASRAKALESAVDGSTQFDAKILLAETEALVAASRAKALESAVETSTQCDEPYRSKALESAVETYTQCDEIFEDPSVAIAAAEASSVATAAAVAAGIAEYRSKALESAVNTSTQSEEPDASIFEAKVSAAAAALRAASLEEAINTSTQCDPEDPSIAASAIASAIAASRTASLEAAVDTCTHAIAASRLASIEAAIDTFTQFEGPSVIDQETQIEYVESVDSGVQSISVDAVDAFIQSEGVETKDSDAQYECTTLVDQETQYDISGVDNSTQSNVAETSECGIQSDEPSTLDAYAQHQIESNDIGVQCEEITQGSTIIPIPLPPVSSRTFSESEDEFFDANSKPSSRRTIDSTMFNNAKPASRSKEIKLMPGSFESELNASEREGVSNNREMMAIGAATAATLANNALTKDNKDASLVDHDFDTLNGPISSETNHDDEFTDKSTTLAALDNYDHIASDDKDNVQGFNNAAPSKDDVQELGNVSPKEKMFSKSETDSLIATAVALALANAFKNKKDNVNSDLLEDRKRHTCDMSLNNNNADSESGMRDIDDQHNNDGDYGNVLVHCPREEDIITSLPYDENAQRRRDRSGLPIIDTSRLDTSSLDTRPLESFKNLEPLQKEIKQERPELTVGPSLVFAQEPEEPEECEITAADVPQRPSNPPPRELLNKASLSSTFTEARSMSPISVRSKGKQPMEYSDLESLSPRSHDDLQRSAVLQQQQQSNLGSKRGSISVSSVSTNNTNEQLRSINSSQYDAVTRSTGTTDPTVINLITQTMIGDWLYKYTRKAVGGGLSERRHQRYFWIHPYTRTLYWSTAAPGVNGNETKAKSALIENITSVPDYSNATDGTPNQSLLIQTSHRQIKLTAPTMEKHELWLEAITHLLARDGSGKGLALLNDTKKSENPNNRSVSSGSGSLLNRPSFRRLHDIFQHPSSAPSMVTSDDHTDLDYDDDEALEDVRMCCNGKHHVSKLEKDHNHRHQYRKRKSRATITTT